MTIDTIQPLGKRVLIKRCEAKAKQGMILLPDSAQEKPKEGTVLAIGPGEVDAHGNLCTVSVKKGDCILYSSYAGTEISDESSRNEEYLILSEDDILGILNRN